MAQLTLYIDEVTLKKIEHEAEREHKSISKWVKSRLELVLKKSWPEYYFDLFGSLEKDDLKRPLQSDFSKDAKRQLL